MSLCNDNFWGYTADIIYKYGVTFLEAAIVQPVWTSILVCYVEGDFGHLLGEEMHQPKYRTRVRGSAHSFHMPWAEILEELMTQCADADVMKVLPRKPDMLQYVVRVQLRVGAKDMNKVLRKMTVRPFVLIALLHFLIDRNHVVFRGQGTAQELKAKMEAAVEELYPVDADAQHLSPEERTHRLPEDLLIYDDADRAATKRQRLWYVKDKNQTPGSGEQDAGQILNDIRPSAVTATVGDTSNSDPATRRAGAFMAHGTLKARTGPNEGDNDNDDEYATTMIKTTTTTILNGEEPEDMEY